MFAKFVVEHNLPFSVDDHFSDLDKKMLPDSNIIKQCVSKRTKFTNFVTRVVDPEMDAYVENLLKASKFSIMVDESNDQGDNKFMAILAIFDPQLQRVATKFLAMPVCNIGSAENLFTKLNKVFM